MQNEKKPLFPPGSKYPLSLLQERYGLCMLFRIRCRSFVALENESRALAYPATSRAAGFKANFPIHRCQKSGWDKPTVETRKHGNDWSFVVHIARFDKKTSQTESVRLEPHPPYLRPTAVEARHWGATYALYRFCNGLQLNRVLPPGPRDYWIELAAEHKNVPEHMKWMQRKIDKKEIQRPPRCWGQRSSLIPLR